MKSWQSTFRSTPGFTKSSESRTRLVVSSSDALGVEIFVQVFKDGNLYLYSLSLDDGGWRDMFLSQSTATTEKDGADVQIRQLEVYTGNVLRALRDVEFTGITHSGGSVSGTAVELTPEEVSPATFASSTAHLSVPYDRVPIMGHFFPVVAQITLQPIGMVPPSLRGLLEVYHESEFVYASTVQKGNW